MSEELIDEELVEFESKRTGLTRQQLLARGVGVAAAAALTGSGAALAAGEAAPKPKRGGRLTWALEQDPVHIAPFGGILTSNHWGKEFMYDSLLEWDANLNVRGALAASWKVINNKTVDFTLKRGVRFHNGKEVTAADCKYSFDLQASPPPPGSVAVLGQFPKIERTQVMSKYVIRIHLSKPDATLFGYLAWSRYSPIVPQGMYNDLNPARQGIGTGPFRLVRYTPNDAVEYTRNPNFWRKGLPYLDHLTLKVLPDEQTRVAALRAGAIDGATLSPDAARQFAGQRGFRVLKNYTAAFRELQFTLKTGENKPWHDLRVRKAVNHALNRQEMINKVYGGNGAFSGHVPPGYGPWPLTQKELRTKYERFDLPLARRLMQQAGRQRGFDVTMTTFSTPADFAALASVMREQLKRINIDLNIEAQEPGTFAARNGTGSFEWDLTARGMRGDVNGYTAEFNPSNGIYMRWYPAYRNVSMWRRVGALQVTLDHSKRLAIAKALQRQLLDEALVQVPLIAVQKFQVVRSRVRNMYVSFSDFNTGIRNVWVD
ncbi:MAG TPA: ABC transporter substrate-binding protein [Gaiellaceae bacterium]|jgi:peptide/nickel transport system substrate-binding protein|nr:ABC transporter substrate-binding protein [Gaiellaceae bacterium]